MNITLKTSYLRDHHLTVCNGEELLRTHKKVKALIQAKFPYLRDEYKTLLATPQFIGTGKNEKIIWHTDIFSSQPQPLSQLEGEERNKYLDILGEYMDAFNDALNDPSCLDVRDIIRQIIACPDESGIYCGDGKISIVEWGLSPREGAKAMNLWGISKRRNFNPIPPAPPTEPDKPTEPIEPADIPPTPPEEPAKEEEPQKPIEPPLPPEEPPLPPEEPPLPPEEPAKSDKKNRLKWLLTALGVIALAVLLFFLLQKCNSKETIGTIPKETPEFKKEDIRIRDDSLRYEIADRINIVVYSGGTLDEFMGDFRKEWPDRNKYQFSHPDTVFNCVVLTVPEEERLQMIDEIPQRMRPKYEVDVIPESITNSTKKTNDPAMTNLQHSYYFDLSNVYEGWDVSMGSEEVVIAVIDCGFDLKHEEFKGKLVKPYNSVTRNNNVFVPQAEGGDHGTHVAATAAGIADNSAGAAGVAPKCKIMPIQAARYVEGWGLLFADSDVLEAIRYAITEGADVINLSIGAGENPVKYLPLPMQQQLIDNAFKDAERFWAHVFKTAESRGIVVVQAAGNNSMLTGAVEPEKRSEHTIRVAAVGPDKSRADFSNFGNKTTISAPGFRIYNAYAGNRYDYMDGTSMASPMVAGAAALLKSIHPELRPHEIKEILVATGDMPASREIPPILNVGCAMKADPKDPQPCDPNRQNKDCTDIQERYDRLKEELERLEREHPECIEKSGGEEMVIPVNPEPEDFNGRWKSTTPIYDMQDNYEVVLYFDFNGTTTGQLTAVGENGLVSTGVFTLSITGDQIDIHMTTPATSSDGSKTYSPYDFRLRPGQDRKADGFAQNQTLSYNYFDFKLIKISN